MEWFGSATGIFAVLGAVLLPALIIYLRYLRRNDEYWKERGINYEPRAAWYTSAWMILTKKLFLLDLELQMYKKHGRIYGLFEGTKPTLTIGDPELLRDVFVKDFSSFHSRREFDFYDPVVNNMVSVLNGEKWKRIRAIITPAFTSGKMRKMSNIINDCSKSVIESFLKDARNDVATDCKKIFGAFTMDVIAGCAFATKINSHDDPNNPFVLHIRKALSKNINRLMFLLVFVPKFIWKLLKIKAFDQDCIKFFRNVTLQVIEERRTKSLRGNDFLQLMMDANEELHETDSKTDNFRTMEFGADGKNIYGHQEINQHIFKANYQNKKLSHDELLAQCILFFMVGYETTGTTLSFAAYNLATHPECQEKLIEEIDQVMQQNGELNYDSIKKLKYLDNVISETLRMYPPGIRTERTASEDYKLGDTGLTIPKGMNVGCPVYAMHYDPEFFPDPDKFIPERFSPENVCHPPYAYLPFGAGPRNCLGMRFALMEIKLCIANILTTVKLKVSPETKVPLQFGSGLGFWRPKGLVLTVEKRKDK